MVTTGAVDGTTGLTDETALQLVSPLATIRASASDIVPFDVGDFFDTGACGARVVVTCAPEPVEGSGVTDIVPTNDRLTGAFFFQGPGCEADEVSSAGEAVTMSCADDESGSATECTRGGTVTCAVSVSSDGFTTRRIRPAGDFDVLAMAPPNSFATSEDVNRDALGRDSGFTRLACGRIGPVFAMGGNDPNTSGAGGSTVTLAAFADQDDGPSAGPQFVTTLTTLVDGNFGKVVRLVELPDENAVLAVVWLRSRAQIDDLFDFGGRDLDGAWSEDIVTSAVLRFTAAEGSPEGFAVLWDGAATTSTAAVGGGFFVVDAAVDAAGNMWLAYASSGPLPPSIDPDSVELFADPFGAGPGAWFATSTSDGVPGIELRDDGDAETGPYVTVPPVSYTGSDPFAVGIRLDINTEPALATDAFSGRGDQLLVSVRVRVETGSVSDAGDGTSGLYVRLGFDDGVPDSDDGLAEQMTSAVLNDGVFHTYTYSVAASGVLRSTPGVPYGELESKASTVEEVFARLSYLEFRVETQDTTDLSVSFDSVRVHTSSVPSLGAPTSAGVLRMPTGTAAVDNTLAQAVDVASYPAGASSPQVEISALCAHPTDAARVYSVFSTADGVENPSFAVFKHDAAGVASPLVEVSTTALVADHPLATSCAVDSRGRIVVGVASRPGSTGGAVYALSPSGFVLWQRTLSGYVASLESEANSVRVAVDSANFVRVTFGNLGSFEPTGGRAPTHVTLDSLSGSEIDLDTHGGAVGGFGDSRDVCVGAATGYPYVAYGFVTESGTAGLLSRPVQAALWRPLVSPYSAPLAVGGVPDADTVVSDAYSMTVSCPNTTGVRLGVRLSTGADFAASPSVLASASLTSSSPQVEIESLFDDLGGFFTLAEYSFDGSTGPFAEPADYERGTTDVSASAEAVVVAGLGGFPHATAFTADTVFSAADRPSGVQDLRFTASVRSPLSGPVRLVLLPNGYESLDDAWLFEFPGLSGTTSTTTASVTVRLPSLWTTGDAIEGGGGEQGSFAPEWEDLWGGIGIAGVGVMYTDPAGGGAAFEWELAGFTTLWSRGLDTAVVTIGTTTPVAPVTINMAVGDLIGFNSAIDDCASGYDTDAPVLRKVADDPEQWEQIGGAVGAVRWTSDASTTAATLYEVCPFDADGTPLAQPIDRLRFNLGVNMAGSPWVSSLVLEPDSTTDPATPPVLSPAFDADAHIPSVLELTQSGGALPIEFSYTVELDGDTDSDTVVLSATMLDGTRLDGGNVYQGADLGSLAPVTAGVPPSNLTLPDTVPSAPGSTLVRLRLASTNFFTADYFIAVSRSLRTGAELTSASIPDPTGALAPMWSSPGTTASVELDFRYLGSYTTTTSAAFVISDGATIASMTRSDATAVPCSTGNCTLPVPLPSATPDTLTIVVQSEDGANTNTYFLEVDVLGTRADIPESGAAVLSSGTEVAAAVNGELMELQVSYPFEETALFVRATLAAETLADGPAEWFLLEFNGEEYSTVGGPYASGELSDAAIDLSVASSGTAGSDERVGAVEVVPEGGRADYARTYDIVATRELSTIATVSAIDMLDSSEEAIDISLSPNVTAGVFEYTASVPRDVDEVFVEPFTTSAEATLDCTVFACTYTLGVPGSVTLVEFTVTAADMVTSQTYRVSLTRLAFADAVATRLDSSNGDFEPVAWEAGGSTAVSVGVADRFATVSWLIQTESFAFVSAVLRDDGVTAVYGPLTAPPTGAEIDADGNGLFEVAGVPVRASTDSETFTVRVLAEDRVTAAEYTVEMRRLSTNTTVVAAVAVPAPGSGVEANVTVPLPSFNFSIPFEAADVTLVVWLAEGARTTEVLEAVEDVEAVEGGGYLPGRGFAADDSPWDSGEEISVALPTPEAETTYRFFLDIEPEAGSQYTTTQLVTVTRELSVISTLSGITVRRTDTEETQALNEAFSPATTSYTVSVQRAVTEVSIQATAASSAAAVVVTPEVLTLSRVDTAYRATVTVTAADGSSTTYRVSVSRIPATDASIAEVELVSAWQEDVGLPDVVAVSSSVAVAELPSHVFEVYVGARAASDFARVSVAGGEVAAARATGLVTLIPASTAGVDVPVVITAEDRSTVATYTIRLRRRGRVSPAVNPSFQATSSFDAPAMVAPASAAVNDVALFCGGRSAEADSSAPVDDCLAVPSAADPALFSLSQPRSGLAAAAAGDFVLVAGGTGSDGSTVDTVDVFAVVPGSQAMEAVGALDGVALSVARSQLTGATATGGALFIGGLEAPGIESCVIDVFVATGGAFASNSSSDTGGASVEPVSTGAFLSTCRRLASAVVVGGDVLLVAGGLAAGDSTTDAVDAFLVSSDGSVSTLGFSYLFGPRYGIAAAATESHAYFAGGWTSVDGDLSRSLDIAVVGSGGSSITWVRTSMLYARAGASGFVVNDQFHTYGGMTQICGADDTGLPCGEDTVTPPTRSGPSLSSASDGRDTAASTRRHPRAAALSAGSSAVRAGAITAVSPDGTRTYRTDDSSLADSSERRRSLMGGSIPVVGGSAVMAGGVSGGGSAATSIVVMTPRQPCADLNFCHGSGECVGEAPDERCDCFDGYEGDSCALLSGSAHDLVRTVSIVSTVGPAAVALLSSGSAAAGQAVSVGLMPFVLFLQSMILPLQHNTDLVEVQQAFRALNAVSMNSPSDAPGSEADGNVFEWSHGLLRKCLILVGFALMAVFLTGKLVHCCVFRTILRAGHFVFLFVVLIVPVAESLLDIPELPDYGFYVVAGGMALVVWAVAVIVVRPRLTAGVKLHIMPGRGWASLKRKYRLANMGRDDEGEKQNRSFLEGLSTRRLAERWRDTKERFEKLEVRFAIMDPPQLGPGEGDQNTNMYASQSFTWWRNAQKKALNAEDLEAPVVYQESWMRDSWQKFSYKFFFESVVLYPEDAWCGLRRFLSLWWFFVSTTYTISYVFLAVYFDGETQLFSLIIAGSSYIFLTMLVFPYRAPHFVENILLHVVLLVQLNLFYQLVQDKSAIQYVFAIAGLQLAALPLKMLLTSLLSDEEAYTEHRDRAREEDLGMPARPEQRLMRNSSSASLRKHRQKKRLQRRGRRKKRAQRLDRQNTSTTAINMFGEGTMI